MFFQMEANDPVFFACIGLCPQEDQTNFWQINKEVYDQCAGLPPNTGSLGPTSPPDIPLWGNPIPTDGGWWGTGSTIPVAEATFATIDFGSLKGRPTESPNAPAASQNVGTNKNNSARGVVGGSVVSGMAYTTLLVALF
ncbi:hypothetical protein HDU67_009766 [Dinochytrium kinnereticum]|nr:hypothetical protein HDU67_009766 [Dinochytrium kinnereticum]